MQCNMLKVNSARVSLNQISWKCQQREESLKLHERIKGIAHPRMTIMSFSHPLCCFHTKRDLSYQYMLEMCNHSSFCVFKEQKLKSRTVLKGWFIQKRKFCHDLLKLFQTGFLSAIEHKLHIICTPTNFVSYTRKLRIICTPNTFVSYLRQSPIWHINTTSFRFYFSYYLYTFSWDRLTKLLTVAVEVRSIEKSYQWLMMTEFSRPIA